jgi:hypothetical protein
MWPDAPIPAHKRRDNARLAMVDIFRKVMLERRAHPEVPVRFRAERAGYFSFSGARLTPCARV